MASYLLDAPRLIGWVHVLSLLVVFLGRLPLRWSYLQSMGIILSRPFHSTMNIKWEGIACYLACSIDETVGIYSAIVYASSGVWAQPKCTCVA